MQRIYAAGLGLGVLLIGGAAALAARQARPTTDAAQAPTFSRDVAPILYKNCVSCHRPGEAAPMSFLTYTAARPWARGMIRRVTDGTMPPWHADAAAGTFENERRLTEDEKSTIARWADAGAPEGDPKDLPAPPAFADGWSIGTPDVVLQMAEDYAVPATGTVQYEYFTIPTNFTESKWLQAIEIRPGNRTLVHHVLVYYQAPPDPTLAAAAQALQLNLQHSRTPPPTPGSRPRQRAVGQRRLIATYAPGTAPQVFRPGTAMRLPEGGIIELQMHYTANGTAGTDRSKVGLIFAKEAPKSEIFATQFLNGQFTIPPGAADYQVDTDIGFRQDITLWGVFPHTHVRGKRWNYVLELPDGTRKPLLSVPKYDFNWQTYYMFKEPLEIPKGSRIHSSAWYDNSAANRSNPDPSAEVKWGDQTWEEMQYTGLLLSVRR
jgi:hypothetical protein